MREGFILGMYHWLLADRRRVWIFAIAAAYVGVNILLIVTSVPNAAFKHGADTMNYVGPAKGLLEFGEFTRIDRPGIPETFSAPLYPLVLAGHFMLFDEKTTYDIVIIWQLCLLFATGVFARMIIASHSPNAGTIILALVVFNPNAIGNAHLVETDTLFAFLVIFCFYLLVRFCRSRRILTMLLCGVVCAASAYCRPAGLYLAFLLPLVGAVLITNSEGLPAGRRAVQGGLSGLAGILIVVIWRGNDGSLACDIQGSPFVLVPIPPLPTYLNKATTSAILIESSLFKSAL